MPPPPRSKGTKPWVKPVLTMVHEVTSIGAGVKQPTPISYEGRVDPAIGQFAPATPYATYGPFQNI